MKFTIFGATSGNFSIHFLVKNLFSIASTTSWVRVTIGTCPAPLTTTNSALIGRIK